MGESAGGGPCCPSTRCWGDSLVKVNSVVDRAFERSPSPALARELRDQRDQLIGTLTAILDSPSRQDTIAGRSYWHPNGFAKLVLADDPALGQVRLHVWPEMAADGDIHDHAWDYESTTVAGELTEIVYHESLSGEGSQVWRHTYDRVGHRRFALVDPTPGRLAESAGPRVYAVGSDSGGRPDHIHRFFASKAPAATLLRIGPIVRRFSYVYRPTAEAPQVVAPRPTTRDDVREWIGYLATVVDG
jgi:hypothetical protein